MDRLLLFASVLAWATAGLALPAAVDATECIRGANRCQSQDSLDLASKSSTSLARQLEGGTLGHLPQQQDDPLRSQSKVQDSDAVHVKSHASLRRRTNGPPPRKLSQAEWNDKRSRALSQILEAFESDNLLIVRTASALGVAPERMLEVPLSHEEFNNALKQAGYTGELLPELYELDGSPQRQSGPTPTDEQEEVYLRESARVSRVILSDRDFLRKFRVSLGLDPEGGWPAGTKTTAKWNEALREAGWEGPFFPETYSFSRVSPLDSVKSVFSQAFYSGRRHLGGGSRTPSLPPIRSRPPVRLPSRMPRPM